MDKLDALAAFVASADAGSLAGGGRATGRSRDQVSKLLARLEATLGVTLFERSTRSLVLTEAGTVYLETVRSVLRDLDAAEAAARGRTTAIRGPLRVNAPLMFGNLKLAPIVPEFMDRFPDVALDLKLDDRIVEDPTAVADITLRIASTPAEGHAVVTLCTVRRYLCASSDYLAREDHLSKPQDLRERTCLHYGNLVSGSEWVLERDGTVERVAIRGQLCSNSGLILARAALAGQGIVILPDFLADDSLRAGQLLEVLPGWRVPDLHVFAMMPAQRQNNRKIRTFVEFLAERLRSGRPS